MIRRQDDPPAAPTRPGHALAGSLVLIAMALALAPERSLGADGGGPEYPASRLGVRTAPLLLLSRPDVRTELKLSAEQTASAERTMADLYVKARSLKGKAGADVVAARRAIDETQTRWIDAQLSEPQRARLAQIDLQWEGPAALVSRPIVAESLNLTPDQRARLARAVADRNRLRAEGKATPADEHRLAEQALTTLTPEQKTQWKEMLGRPFVPQVAAGEAPRPKR